MEIMECPETRVEGIESQSSPDVNYDRGRRRYSPFYPISYCFCRIKAFIKRTEEGTPPTGEIELEPEFFTNFSSSDLFHLPVESVQMNPQIFCALSAGNKECIEELRSYGSQMACLKSDQGDSVLHLVAARGHVELVKSIVSDCPCLLLVANSKNQLPLHVAAHAGQLAAVEALVAIVTFISAKLSEEERERLEIYVAKDIDGNTPLLKSLIAGHKSITACLVKANQHSSFLANKDGVSPLYLAVEAGYSVHIVKEMLKGREEVSLSTLGSKLEGRKFLPHAALRAGRIDILNVILTEDPSLEDVRNEKGTTCLSFAVAVRNYEGVCYLLDRSNGVYACNDDGSFPIHVAAENGDLRIVKELVKRCPDSVNLLNKLGQNILHIAVKSRNRRNLLLVYHLKIWHSTRYMSTQQDMDGNTPLHLAAGEWDDYGICVLCVASPEKSLNTGSFQTRNNNGLTALGIMESNLQPIYIFQERLALNILGWFYTSHDKRLFCTEELKQPLDPRDGEKGYLNALLLLATLIATVTFAVGFTVPGGFNSSPPNLGKAVLIKDYRLSACLIFDTVAMTCSTLSITTLVWAQLDQSRIRKCLAVALPLLFFALFSMTVAFYYGVLATVGSVTGIDVVLSISCVITTLVLWCKLYAHVLLQIPQHARRYPLRFFPAIMPFVPGLSLMIVAMRLMKPLLRLYAKRSGKD